MKSIVRYHHNFDWRNNHHKLHISLHATSTHDHSNSLFKSERCFWICEVYLFIYYILRLTLNLSSNAFYSSTSLSLNRLMNHQFIEDSNSIASNTWNEECSSQIKMMIFRTFEIISIRNIKVDNNKIKNITLTKDIEED